MDGTWEPFDCSRLSPRPIIGVDEVGRGCLAGAVYAAAVILDESKDLSAFTDSKLISASRREELSLQIQSEHKVAIAFATVSEIARLNIFHASLLAMRRAVNALRVEEGHVLVDGKFTIPRLKGFPQTAVIKGDLRVKSIAAASIVAKVARDSQMIKLGKKYPQYGFESHKGYSTPEHKQAIKKWGVLNIHRKTFLGVREHVTLSDELV